jgi:hypothetical protein
MVQTILFLRSQVRRRSATREFFSRAENIGIGIRARVSVQAHDSHEQIHFIFVRFPIAIGQRSRPSATASAATGSTTETAVDDTAGCSLYAGCAGGFGREKAHARIFR